MERLYRMGYSIYCTPIGRIFTNWFNASGASPHSFIQDDVNIYQDQELRIFPIPIRSDNYAYAIYDLKESTVVLVDPSEGPIVNHFVQSLASPPPKIIAVLATHKHHDHSGGNVFFSQLESKPQIIGGRGEGTPAVTREVGTTEGEAFQVGRLQLKAYTVPCHTKASILLHLLGPNSTPCLFTGDTLFKAGAGRFFEGNGQDMLRIAELFNGSTFDASTMIFPGHEYSLSNLEFAKACEPQNQDIKAEYERVKALRESTQGCTIPTTLALERLTNPFLRIHTAEVQQFVRSRHPQVGSQMHQLMDGLRDAKNQFK